MKRLSWPECFECDCKHLWGESFLIDIVILRECNHQSQACILAITHVDIAFEDIVAFLTDSASHREMLSNAFINSYHVLCLAHILNLVGEVFSHWPAFDNATQLITFIKSAIFLKSLSKKINTLNGLKVPCLRNKWNYPLCLWQLDGIPGLMQPNITHSLYNLALELIGFWN